MALKSSPVRYGNVAVAIHWTCALLILRLLVSGFRAGGTTDPAAKVAFLKLHVPIGATLLILTVLRIVWWLAADTKPKSVPMPGWQDRASRLTHTLLYILVLGMVASGAGMIVLSGAGPTIFGQDSTSLPDFWDYAPRVPHGIWARVISALVLLHAGAAIYHQFIRKDGSLRRMWFSK